MAMNLPVLGFDLIESEFFAGAAPAQVPQAVIDARIGTARKYAPAWKQPIFDGDSFHRRLPGRIPFCSQPAVVTNRLISNDPPGLDACQNPLKTAKNRQTHRNYF